MLNPANLAKEIFGILRSFDYTVDIFDYDGNRVYEPADARRFFASPRNITVSIYDDGENSAVKMFLSQSTSVNEVAGLIDTMRVTSSKFGVLFNVRKYERELMPKDLAPNSGIEHETSSKLSSTAQTQNELDAIKSDIHDLIDDFPSVLKTLKATKEKADVKEGMTTNTLNEKQAPAMMDLPALGCKVEVDAWNAFKDSQGIDTYRAPEEISEESAPDAKLRLIAQLRAVAKVTVADGLANVFSKASDMLENGDSSLARSIAERAVALAYHPNDVETPTSTDADATDDEPEIDEARGEPTLTLAGLGNVDQLDEEGETVKKPLEVEVSAWNDFKSGNLALSSNIRFDYKFGKDANVEVFYMHEIAEHTKAVLLSRVFTFCADATENHYKGLSADQTKLVKVITARAIAEAKKAAGVVEESVIVTESIRSFASWFDSHSSKSLFEGEDDWEYRDEPHDEAIHSSLGDDASFDQALDIAYDSVKDNFDVGDFLDTDAKNDFNFGDTELTDEEKDIPESDVRSSLKSYIRNALEHALEGTEYPSEKDIEGLVDQFLPEVKEAMENEGWKVSSDTEVTEEIDMGQAKSAQDRKDERKDIPFADQDERNLRNKAIGSESDEDWAAWRKVRDARISGTTSSTKSAEHANPGDIVVDDAGNEYTVISRAEGDTGRAKVKRLSDNKVGNTSMMHNWKIKNSVVNEDDDDLANEDVLLPVDAANDLTRDVSAKHAGTDNDRMLLLSKAIRGKY